MSIHYIHIFNCQPPANPAWDPSPVILYDDYVAISDDQLEFLKFFFECFLEKRNKKKNLFYDKQSKTYYSFKEISENKIDTLFIDMAYLFNDKKKDDDAQKCQVIVYQQVDKFYNIWHFEYLSLTKNQVEMLDFLDGFMPNFIDYENLADKNFQEIIDF